jgi:hypothetical protein
MPRAVDPSLPGGGLPVTHSPLNRIPFQKIVPPVNFATILEQFAEDLPNQLEQLIIPAIKDLTGIDLSGLIPLFESFEGQLGLSLPDLTNMLAGLDFSSPEAFWQSLVAAFIEFVDFLTADSPINVANLFGMIPDSLIGLIPYSHVGDAQPNLLTAPTFDDPENIEGAGIWMHDPTVGRTELGSVKVIANGTDLRLVSNTIPVTPAQQMSFSTFVCWTGLAFTGTPLKLQLVRYLNHAVIGIDDIAAPSSPGASQTSFVALSGSYTVPPVDEDDPTPACDEIRVQFFVSHTATAGTIWFDDAEAKKTGLLQIPWVQGLPKEIADGIQRFQDTVDTIWQGVTRLDGVDKALSEMFDALQAIDSLNILGFGGPATVADTWQATWDQLISGFVGALGTGSSLASLFNIGQEVSSQSAQGRMSFDILGRRNNKSLDTGLMDSSESSFAFSKVALQPSLSTFGVTQSASSIVFQRMAEDVDKATIQWMGNGVANITDFRVVVWLMDTVTGKKTPVHTSANLTGLLSSTTQYAVYQLPTAISVKAGEVYGIELCVVGSGTYNVVGQQNSAPNHPIIYPANLSATRNSATTFPPASTPITPTYGTNVPFIEFGVKLTGTPAPHSPVTVLVSTSGTITVPDWSNYIDVIALGGGGGGQACGLVWGEGGKAGSWANTTLTRDTDIPRSTTVLNVTIGNGGAPGSGFGDGGAAGTASTVSAAGMTTLSAAGGAGGSAGNADYVGKSPGNRTVGGVTYAGGQAAQTPRGKGNSPGGGGAGSSVISVAAGSGAKGSVVLVFRQ